MDRLEKEGLRPSKRADPYTLVRRIFLDLIGLPTNPEEIDSFVSAFRKNKTKVTEALIDDLMQAARLR